MRRRGSPGRSGADRDPGDEREETARDASGKRSTPNNSTSAAAPTANVAPLVSPRCLITCANWRIVSPSPFPSEELGSWLTVTKIASPKTKPAITGRERNCAINPSLRGPRAGKRPQKSTSAAEWPRSRPCSRGERRRPTRKGARPPPTSRGHNSDGSSRRSRSGECRKQRVEPGLRWHPGEPGVGDHLRDRRPQIVTPATTSKRRATGRNGSHETMGTKRWIPAASAQPQVAGRHVPSADRNRRAQRGA